MPFLKLMKTPDVKRILIIKLRNIGDVLLTVPAIRAVRERYPNAYIAVLVNRGTEEMLTGNPLINEVITYDRSIKSLHFFKKLVKEAAFLMFIREKKFDMVVDLTSGDRAAMYSFLGGAKLRYAYDPEGRGFFGKSFFYTRLGKKLGAPNHMVIQNLHLVRQFGMDTDDLKVDIYFSEEDKRFVKDLLLSKGIRQGEPFIHIHPTSRWLFKCWKDEYMAEIIGWLIDRGTKVVLTSSPEKKEMERAKRISSLLSQLTTHNSSLLTDLCGNTTLKHLAVISKKAYLFFGVDSAPMHIAAAVGTPVVALFGPTGAYDWGPWDNKSLKFKVQSPMLKGAVPDLRTEQGKIVESGQSSLYKSKNGIRNSGIHTVIQKDWDCVPCGKDGCGGSKRSKCLDEIEVSELQSVLVNSLKKVN